VGSDTLTGTRIRERRAGMGLRQADLARQVGISPSYLNLIEHNRRGIGGKLLIDISRVLGVEVAALTEGAEAALLEALRAAAARVEDAGAELDRAEELAGRFPGWARSVAALHDRISALEEAVDSLSDRLTHDPFLAESVHEILSTVTAIRSASSILAQTPDIEPEWRERFHGNIFRDSQRLSETSQALVAHFDRLSREETGFATAPDATAAFAEAHGYHFPALEAGGDPEPLIEAAPALDAPAAARMARGYLDRYAADARAVPLDRFEPAAERLGYDPARLAADFDTDLLTVFRRLASLPTREGRPEFGLVACDGSGTVTFRKPLPGFSLPRYGAACPLWPLYQALIRPTAPVRAVMETPDETRFLAYAMCQPVAPSGFGGPQVVEAGMLFLDAGEAAPAPGETVFAVGTSCRICPRADCVARREPSILREEF